MEARTLAKWYIFSMLVQAKVSVGQSARRQINEGFAVRAMSRSGRVPVGLSKNCRGFKGNALNRDREIDHHEMILRPRRREPHHFGERMGGFERRDDAFEPRAQAERGERFLIGSGQILHALDVVEPGVLGTDARIIEPIAPISFANNEARSRLRELSATW
jgi:hypothetical protein